MKMKELIDQALTRWPDNIEIDSNIAPNTVELFCRPELVPGVCDWLFNQQGYHFAGLIVEENSNQWDLFYLFVGRGEMERIQVRTSAPLAELLFQSVSRLVHAAD